MYKKILILLVCCFMMFSLVGCNSDNSNKQPDNTQNVQENKPLYNPYHFVILHTDRRGWAIAYHYETKVMYVISNTSYNVGVFTVMVDADGKPLLYEGDE